MKTLLDPVCHERLLARLRLLTPDTPAQWGGLTAPRLIAHLSDAMRNTLGELEVAPLVSPLRWPVLRSLAMFWLPWPKARIKGPPEMFTTLPTTWAADLSTLEGLLARFVGDARASWPEHAYFGPMRKATWGRFIHRHFDHHLRQFGV